MKNSKRLLACAFILTLLLSALAGCGGGAAASPSKMNDMMISSEGAPYPTPMPAAAPGEYYEDGGLGGSEMSAVITSASNPVQQQKLIYTVYLSIETLEYDSSIATIERLCSDFGGYVEYASVSGNSVYGRSLRYASFVLRVPAEGLDGFQEACADAGNITNARRETENATAAYTDLSARLKSYKTEEDRLLELLSEAGDLESLIALNARLAQVRYEIESIESSLRGIDSAVSYSTVHIDLSEVVRESEQTGVPRTFGERVAAASSGAAKDFAEAMSSLGVFLLGTLPLNLLLVVIYLIPLAVIAAAVLLIIRSRRRKRASAAKAYYKSLDGGEGGGDDRES